MLRENIRQALEKGNLETIIDFLQKKLELDNNFNESIKNFLSKNILKNLSTNTQVDTIEWRNKVTTLIERHAIRQALKLMNKDYFSDEYRNQIIGVTSRYERLRKEVRTDVIEKKDYNIESNKIVQAILDIIDDLLDKDIIDSENLKHIDTVQEAMTSSIYIESEDEKLDFILKLKLDGFLGKINNL